MRAIKVLGWIVLGLAAALGLGLALGVPVMWLWNWLMPELFHLPAITFWQAVGLLVLSHLLFKGHVPISRRHEKRHRAHWDAFAGRVKSAMEQESAQPTPEGEEP